MLKANKSIRKINVAAMSMSIIGAIVMVAGLILNFVLPDTLPIAKATLLLIFLGVGLGLFIISVILLITNAYKLKRFQLTLNEYEVFEENNTLNISEEFAEKIEAKKETNPFAENVFSENIAESEIKQETNSNSSNNVELEPKQEVVNNFTIDGVEIIDTNTPVEQPNMVDNVIKPVAINNANNNVADTPSVQQPTIAATAPTPTVIPTSPNQPLKPIGLSPISTQQPSFSANQPLKPITPMTKPIPNTISPSFNTNPVNRPATISPMANNQVNSQISSNPLPTINRQPSVQIPQRNVSIPTPNTSNGASSGGSMFSSRHNQSK